VFGVALRRAILAGRAVVPIADAASRYALMAAVHVVAALPAVVFIPLFAALPALHVASLLEWLTLAILVDHLALAAALAASNVNAGIFWSSHFLLRLRFWLAA